MTKKGKLEGLDNCVMGLFGFSFVVPTLISQLGLNVQLMVIPSIFYSFWILFTGYFQPKVSFSDFPERSEIERMRGWTYVLGLPICLVLNFLFVFVLPKDFSILLIGSFLVSYVLGTVVAVIPRNIFKKEIAKMNVSQIDLVRKILTYAGGSMIYSSMALLFLTTTIPWMSESPIYVIGLSIVSVVFLIVSYDRHRKSSKYADELATSLKNDKKEKKKS